MNDMTPLADRVTDFAFRNRLALADVQELMSIVELAMREGAALAKRADADGRAAAREAMRVCVLPGEPPC